MAKALMMSDGSGYLIECPACGNSHKFDKRWEFFGTVDNPTFSPSMKVEEPGWPYVKHDRWLEVEMVHESDNLHLRFHRDLVGDDCPADVNEVAKRLGVEPTLEALRAATRGFNATLPGRVCHSFVRNGEIEFLSDCTHDMAGKTVPLPDM